MIIADIELDDDKFPKHLGIIMDGNSRWAENKGYAKIRGYRAGMRSIKKILNLIQDTPIETVTLFAFSKENWSRPKNELKGLFDIIRQFYKSEYPSLKKKGIKIIHSGDYDLLDKDIIQLIETMKTETKDNKGKVLNLAFNYSGRNEITRAIKRIINKGFKEDDITEELVNNELDHPEIDNMDLVIRTSGELRVSNFCLWQLAYSEFFFTDVLWPDFDKKHFAEAIKSYQNRNRRFGGREE